MNQPQHLTLALLLAWSGAVTGFAEGTNSIPPRELHLTQVRQLDALRQKQYGASANFLVRPGLLADKTGRVVRICAESLSLKPGDPVEFPLITGSSGKDYEALAVSFASGQDIHEALLFIGLAPGRGTDPSKLRFWPKGDRVRVNFQFNDPGSSSPPTRQTPAEQLVLDTRTGRPLPETGFVFTGSEWMPAVEAVTGKVYAADAFSPGSIIALYNEWFSVLDVPRRAPQQEVYARQVPNPDCTLPANQLIEITLEPFYRDGGAHACDLTLVVAPLATEAGTPPAPSAGNDPRLTGPPELSFTLQDRTGVLNTNRSLTGLLATLEAAAQGSRDLFVTVEPAPATPLGALREACRLLETLDNDRGIRIEPPPAGHPYYRAFLPAEKFRRREDRTARVVELHLDKTVSGTATGTLVWVDSEWKNDDTTQVFHETRVGVGSPAGLDSALGTAQDLPAVMLVFAPPDLTYGSLREFLVPVLKRNLILYVFL